MRYRVLLRDKRCPRATVILILVADIFGKSQDTSYTVNGCVEEKVVSMRVLLT
jgi:hypothetical protein